MLLGDVQEAEELMEEVAGARRERRKNGFASVKKLSGIHEEGVSE
ncbi:hypothetical protein PC116_g2274 [Phytophthora cactorum]|uniref:Uncharacterized protein n=1 Tax=Phytophthora cactorum TaxID=29920 RepID=A0A8T1DE55_9STRA|nr:hypothetical protein GQ600_12679 [Phytophthora cactorum]KAG2766897.1 hypothetical protein Pcac1_g21764 [Phytophthora cactorum]KAG2796497.1 hypothetical protein PC111_g21696 [Phytophthora cactorum]KAG2906210.1 hypothetical protein PC114_g11253 [Phytophthora cactorum]KAG2938121.1 hypothetical protein PC117_g11390 [Phytophthora cactorum]